MIKQSSLFPEIDKVIKTLNSKTISEDRKAVLEPLIAFIQTKVSNKETIRLHFICTHNSRRSHLSQVWAQVMADYFSINRVFCYSGGTVATAVFPMVLETLRNSGFQIKPIAKNENPVYNIKYAPNEHPVIGFSKKIDNDFNPKSKFAAVMTCDTANEACPFVVGGEKRIAITYQDPKAFDNTPQEKEKYKEKSFQIATELFYVFSKINA